MPGIAIDGPDGPSETATYERRVARFTRDFSNHRLAWRPPARWMASAGSEWSDAPSGVCPVAEEGRDSAGQPRHRFYLWAELMRRTFGIDVLDCPRCGGRLRLLALIEHERVVERSSGTWGFRPTGPRRGPHGRRRCWSMIPAAS
jgi:hypothetical protein